MLLAQAVDKTRYDLVGLLVFIGIIAILVWAISYGVRSGITRGRPQDRLGSDPQADDDDVVRFPYLPPMKRPAGAAVFPVESSAAGRFKIIGVDRDSKMDTVWYCHAETIENARAKGELEGIYVTSVERVPESSKP